MTLKEAPIRSGRILALDGWRGIAILLVLFGHIQVGFLGHHLSSWTRTGQHGVTIFFVLSGFLITSKLVERDIVLKDFYIRRFFRLMPAAWTYLAAIVLLSRLTGAPFTSPAELRACVLFYRNFSHVDGLAGHFWSLSVEEQFYLVWPAILLLAGIRRSRWIAALGAIACAVYRFAFWSHYDRLTTFEQTQVRADALLVGCLAALLLTDPQFKSIARKWVAVLALPAFVVLIYGIARFYLLPPLYECTAISVLIMASVLYPRSVFVRALSVRPLAWIGVISYSIYLWQELFVRIELPPHAKLFAGFIAMPLFAIGSYYCIERPCTRIGHRLTSKRPGQTTATASTESAAPAVSSSASSPEIS